MYIHTHSHIDMVYLNLVSEQHQMTLGRLGGLSQILGGVGRVGERILQRYSSVYLGPFRCQDISYFYISSWTFLLSRGNGFEEALSTTGFLMDPSGDGLGFATLGSVAWFGMFLYMFLCVHSFLSF